MVLCGLILSSFQLSAKLRVFFFIDTVIPDPNEEETKITAASHPFRNYDNLKQVTSKELVMTNDYYYSLEDENKIRYSLYDGTPMAWYLITFAHTMYVTDVVVRSPSFKDNFTDFFIASRLNSDRVLNEYKENGKKVSLSFSLLALTSSEHKLN